MDIKPQNKALVESQMDQSCAKLFDKYKEYAAPIVESYERKKKPVDKTKLATVLQSLDNLNIQLNESTSSVNVGNFIQHGYHLVSSIYPNLVLSVISSLQPLQYRSGEVYYYNFVYETAKGLTAANTPAFAAKTGVRVDKHYSSEYVDALSVDVPNSVLTTFNGTIPNAPLRTNAGLDFFFGTDGVETFAVDPNDFSILIGSEGGTGTLNITTGVYQMTFNTAPLTGAQVFGTGKIDFETLAGAGQGRTKINLVNEPIYANQHQLITDYTLEGAHTLNRNFGMNMDDELIKSNSALIRAEIDQLGMCDIKRVAQDPNQGSGITSWDATIPSGISELDHFRTLLTILNNQKNQIYDGTRMVYGNFIISGNSVSSILESLPEYQPNTAIGTELVNSGPYVAGKINGLLHIKNPDFDKDEWVMGNRGNTAFNTGYVLAPYRPLMVTAPTSDATNPFSITRGLWTELGRKVVNSKFYAYGTIENSPF